MLIDQVAMLYASRECLVIDGDAKSILSPR